jgi:uncharacterized protein YcgI (DUF1989 family)
MTLTAPTTLLPAQGIAFDLDKGDAFRIVDVEGRQVSDLVVFSALDPTERFSPGNSRKLNGTGLLSTGHVLYSTKCRPLLAIAADSVGRHDLTSSACSPYDYPIRFGISDHPSCLAILTEVLAPRDIPEYLIPDPFNVFMKTVVDEAGAIAVVEPESVPGDAITFHAVTPCLVAMTCCPQDQNACNGGTITPLRIEPVPPRAAFRDGERA